MNPHQENAVTAMSTPTPLFHLPKTAIPTTSPALVHGESVLTVSQFRLFLEMHNLRFARRTIYRWLNVSKEYLPHTVQALLTPAPPMWFIHLPPGLITHTKQVSLVIPLRYLSEEYRASAQGHTIQYISQPSIITTMHAMKNLCMHLQQQISELETYLHTLTDKDIYDEH